MRQKVYKVKSEWGRFFTALLAGLIAAIAFPFIGYTQGSSVRGTVTDAKDGTTLVGANIIIKSTTRGAITDLNGNFTIDANPGEVLVVSYIGYLNQEIVLQSQNVLNIALQPDMVSLHELVVVGFGEQKKVNLSGAVDAVDGKILENRPIQTIGQGLQGVVPNLNIDFLSGEPGTAPRINIRGFTSINGGHPLIIVDGMPTEPEQLNLLSPNDIESISVLKDASSAAIYGARAAYGVILLTTKKGSGKGVAINYTNNFAVSRPTVLPDKITDPYIYLRLQETSTNNTPWDNMNYTDETYRWAKERSENPSIAPVRLNPADESLWEYMGNRDWTKEFLDNSTLSQNHNLSVGGQSDKVSYYLSGSYALQKGAIKLAEDKYDRYTLNGKINFTPYKWLTFGNNTLISTSERSRPYHLSIFDIYNLAPTDWDVNPDGTWANNDAGRMGARLTNGGDINNKTTLLQTTLSGEMSFLERMFRINADYSIRRINADSSAYQTRYKIGYGPNDIREEGTNEALRIAQYTTYSVLNVYGTFEKTLGHHFVNAVAGFNQEYNKYEWFSAYRGNIISGSLPTIGLATGEAIVNEQIRDWALRGAFYRLNYIYNNKYILEFNGRYDGSSKFPKDNRFGFFPSYSAAWRIDEEGFWSGLTNVVNQFKIRASYGSLGNQYVSEYGYIATMNSDRGNYLIGGTLPQMVTSPQLVSPNYTWEKVNSQNLGVDLGFFKQRITATFDIYRRDTKGMLVLGKDLPNVIGASEPKENAADLKTTGWELSLGYNNEFNVGGKPFNFTSSFVLSDSRSYITKFDNPTKSLAQFYEGQELGEIWGLQSDGLFKNEDEIATLDETAIIPWGALNIVPGWPKYKDLDNSGTIEKGLSVDDPKDLSVIGNITPRFRFGINLGFNWGGFDVSAFLQGVGKMDYYPVHHLYWGFYQQPYAGGYSHLLDFYRPADDSDIDMAKHSQSYINAGLANANLDAKYPVLQAWLADRNLGERIDESMGLAIPQTGYMLNGAYVRLKNLTVGYSLPTSVLSRTGIKQFRIYLSGENITEWSEIKKFFDPEAITDNTAKYDPSYSSQNGWGYAYPFQRRFSAGVNIGL